MFGKGRVFTVIYCVQVIVSMKWGMYLTVCGMARRRYHGIDTFFSLWQICLFQAKLHDNDDRHNACSAA